MFVRLAIVSSLVLATPAFAGPSTETGATVTTTDVYDDFCRTTVLPKRGGVLEECFFADFRVHKVVTPSGNALYTWDGERSMDAYLNGVHVRHQELSGRILSVTVDGDAQIDSRDTCFYVQAEDVYREVEIHVVNGELVIHDVEDVESCD